LLVSFIMDGFDAFFAPPGQGATASSQEAASATGATGGQADYPVGASVARAAPRAAPPTMREQVKAKKQHNRGQNYPKIYNKSKNIFAQA
jgi:hypothetical protein